MVRAILYVEGGSRRGKAAKIDCQQAFSEFVRKAGQAGRMPRIIACGGRRDAYNKFCLRLRAPVEPDLHPMLLVDSEEAVTAPTKWAHVALREKDKWKKPASATEEHLFLMVECMENWFLADTRALQKCFGQEFNPTRLPAGPEPEAIPKSRVLEGLREASKRCAKGKYDKGAHSFEILRHIDPEKVKEKCPRAMELLISLASI